MEYRLGTCSSCDAQYRVPATFKADQAKCKKCEGVVEIGPVQGGESKTPAAVPAKKPAPRPEAKRPAAKKPAARPAQKAAAKAAPTKGTPKAGASAKRRDSVRDAAEAAAGRVKDAGKGSSGGSSSRQKSTGKSAGKSSGSSSRRSRRSEKPKKKSPALAIAGILALAAVALGAFFFLKSGDSSETQAAETDVAAANADATETPAEETNGESGEAAGEEPSETPVEEAPVEEPAAAVEKEPEAPPDPSEIDLSLLPDQEKLPETSDEEWIQIKQWTATFVDPDAGAAGNRARGQLLEKGRVAFPALLNAFKRVDVSSDEGYRTGDLIQRLLKDICRGNNFDWRYTTEPKDALFNKKVIQIWHRSWDQVVDDPKAWIRLGKLTDEEAAEYLAEFQDPGDIGSADDLDDF